MKNLVDLFRNLRRLDLTSEEVQDSLYRISDWLADEENKESDTYVQKQLLFLSKFIKDAEEKDQCYFIDEIAKKTNKFDTYFNDLAKEFNEHLLDANYEFSIDDDFIR